jgi:hypothetical protein
MKVNVKQPKSETWFQSKYLLHYTTVHAAINYYTANDHFKDHACRLSFSSKAALFYHILGGASASGRFDLPGNRCAYRDRVLEQFDASANIVADV